MNRILFFIGFCMLIQLTSCVSNKKYKALNTEKTKIENTLLKIKKDLAEAKRELNKFKDAANQTDASKSDKIKALEKAIEENQEALDVVQQVAADCQLDLTNLQSKYKKEIEAYEAELAPLRKVKAEVVSHSRALRNVQEDITTAYKEAEGIKVNILFGEVTLTLVYDQSFLFANSRNLISTKGREAMTLLAKVLEEHERLKVDIVGHAYNTTSRQNWQLSAQKPQTIINLLEGQGINGNRLKGTYRGSHNPASSSNNKMNNRTEIILHYQKEHLLKLIPTN